MGRRKTGPPGCWEERKKSVDNVVILGRGVVLARGANPGWPSNHQTVGVGVGKR